MRRKAARSKTGLIGIPSRIASILLLSMMLLAARPQNSAASDVIALSKKLAAAFIANQVVFMCTLEIGAFAQETAGARGTTRDYLEHVRAEVLSSILTLEAKRIVIRAAEITRETGAARPGRFNPTFPKFLPGHTASGATARDV